MQQRNTPQRVLLRGVPYVHQDKPLALFLNNAAATSEKARGMKVTISPCSPSKVAGKLRSSSPLLEIAQAISDDCEHGVTVEVLDDCGKRAAVFGKQDDDAVELF